MKLYHYPVSSASWRARIALHHKGLAFTEEVVDLRAGDQHGDEHRARNPIAQVPLLEWEEGGKRRRLGQSMAIVLFLEQLRPAPPLLPADPWLRARAWQLAEIVNSGIQPLQNLYVRHSVEGLGADSQAWAAHHVRRGLDALEAEAASTAGAHLVGDQVSVADVCLVPQLAAARRLGLDDAGWPVLLRAEAACAELPAFVAARPH